MKDAMDGFLPAEHGRRRTLKAPIGCMGDGLHTGRRMSLTLRPAAAGTGILFRRTDLGLDIPVVQRAHWAPAEAQYFGE